MTSPRDPDASEGGAAGGQVAGLQRSRGGVPKLPVRFAEVRVGGMEGNWQRNQGRRIARVAEKVNPGWSRVYARVLREGVIHVGDAARMLSEGGADQLELRININ